MPPKVVPKISFSEKPFIANMSETVIQVNLEGIDLDKPESWDKIEAPIKALVKKITDKLKASHTKFVDPDFGPNEKDPFGAISLYGSDPPDPSGSKYPPPENLKWVRPQYADDNAALTEETPAAEEEDDEFAVGGAEKEEEEVTSFCWEGRLFAVGGSSSRDVVQGQLGDCWFLGALAVLGAHPNLLMSCFWPFRDGPEAKTPDGTIVKPDMTGRTPDCFKEYGFYVLRFFKDSTVIYVIIDDTLPANKKDNNLVFAHCKDNNILWVPIIEKAYAKLHGNYKALIGGFAHYALGDLTGYCPRLVVTKPGLNGFTKPYDQEQLWTLLTNNIKWGSLMGCSIQSDPGHTAKVEHDAGLGLMFGHAYSLLDCNEVDPVDDQIDKRYVYNGKFRLVKVRNPWGRKEWEGSFADETPERNRYDPMIKKAFNKGNSEDVEEDTNDGTFLIPFYEWFQRYNNLFLAVKFPSSWCGRRCRGEWSGKVGGNRQQEDFFNNPKIKIKLKDSRPGDAEREIFVGIYIRDSRMRLGVNYYHDPLYGNAVAFDILTPHQLEQVRYEQRQVILCAGDDNPKVCDPQPAYNFGTTQTQTKLKVNQEYYIVPSLGARGVAGTYFVVVYADADDLELQGDVRLVSEHEPKAHSGGAPKDSSATITSRRPSAAKLAGDQAVPGLPASTAAAQPPATHATEEAGTMTKAQFYQLREVLRERFVNEIKRLGLSKEKVLSIYRPVNIGNHSGGDVTTLAFSVFKTRILELGFNLSDFPESELKVLDDDSSGTIDQQEFERFLAQGLKFAEGNSELLPPPPPKPVDDLLLKLPELQGTLIVDVIAGRNLRKPITWFTNTKSVAPATSGAIAGTAGTGSSNSALAGPLAAETETMATRKIIKYDPKVAATTLQAMIDAKETAKVMILTPPPPPLPSSKAPISDEKSAHILSTLHDPDFSSPMKGTKPKTVALDAQSVTSKLRAEKLGKEAGSKLHIDAELQAAEASRTEKLLKLKKEKHSVSALSAASSVERESVLRRPQVTNKGAVANGNDQLERIGKLFDEKPDGIITFDEFKNTLKDKLHLVAVNDEEAKDMFLNLYVIAHTVDHAIKMPVPEPGKPFPPPISLTNFVNMLKALQHKPMDIRMDKQTMLFLGIPFRNDNRNLLERKLRKLLVKVASGEVIDKLVDSDDEDLKKVSPRALPIVSPRVKLTSAIAVKQGSVVTTTGKDAGTVHDNVVPGEKDIWDILVDNVYTISKAREDNKSSLMTRAITELDKMGTPRIQPGKFAAFDKPYTPIRAPSRISSNSVAPLKKLKQGSPPINKSLRAHSGTASVTTKQTAAQQRTTIDQVKDRLKSIAEDQGNEFEEVYRRLVAVPVTTAHELEGDRYAHENENENEADNPVLYKLFRKFDRNGNGLISRDEFKDAMKDMNISMSSEDCDTLFNRFQTVQDDDQIEWKEFMTFFDTHIKRNSDILAEHVQLDQRPSLVSILEKMRSLLGPKLLPPKTTSDTEKQSSALLNELNNKSNGTNVALFKSWNIDITPDEMSRINRIFNKSVEQFTDFLRSYPAPTDHATTVATTEAPAKAPVVSPKIEFSDARKFITDLLMKRIECRSGATADSGITSKHTTKLWITLKGSIASNASFSEISEYFVSLVEEALHTHPAATEAIAAAASATTVVVPTDKKPKRLHHAFSGLDLSEVYADAGPDSLHKATDHQDGLECCKIGGYSVQVLCNIIVDAIMHTQWNRGHAMPKAAPTTTTKKVIAPAAAKPAGPTATGNVIAADSVAPSPPGVTAASPSIASGGAKVSTVAPVATSSSKTAVPDGHSAVVPAPSAVVAVADELSYSGFEAFAREVHVELLENKLRYLVHLEMNMSSNMVYMLVHVYVNIKRDQVVVLAHDPTAGQVFKYDFREDVKDLPMDDSLRAIFQRLHSYDKDSSYLHGPLTYNPWETPVEDAAISEMVGRLRLVNSPVGPSKLILAEDPKFVGQLKSLIANIGATPFFCLASDLVLYFELDSDALLGAADGQGTTIEKVVFGTIRKIKPLYNFLTASISSLKVALATYNGGRRIAMDWTEMLAYLCDYRNPFVTVQLLPKFVEPEEYFYDPDVKAEGFTGDEVKETNPVMASLVDTDGGCFPRWNAKFKAEYRQSQMTTCKIVSREVTKLKIEGVEKYVVVLVREGQYNANKDKKRPHNTFFFMTIYDPRSATDYQCGLVASCPLKKKLLEEAPPTAEPKYIEEISSLLDQAVAEKHIIVGPAITPRVVLNLYNRRGRQDELLGTCQISVSSVLSSSGSLDPVWNKLTYTVLNNGKPSDMFAGEVSVDMLFQKDAGEGGNGDGKSGGRSSRRPSAAPSRKNSAKVAITNVASSGANIATVAAAPLATITADHSKAIEAAAQKAAADALAAAEKEKRLLKEQHEKDLTAIKTSHDKLKEHNAALENDLKVHKEALDKQKESLKVLQQKQNEIAVPVAASAHTADFAVPEPKAKAMTTANELIVEITKELKKRQDKKIHAGFKDATVLGPLEKMLQSLAHADGVVDDLTVFAALTDLTFDVTKELAAGLIAKARADYKIASTAPVHWQAIIAVVSGAPTYKPPQPSASQDISKQSSTASIGGKREIQEQSPAASLTDKHVPKDDNHPKHKATAAVPTEKPSAVAVEETKDPSREKPASKPQERNKEVREKAQEPAPVESAVEETPEEKAKRLDEWAKAQDWDSYPLPSKVWSKRFDQRSNRIYYANSDLKSTQWFHPSDPSQFYSKSKPSAPPTPTKVQQTAPQAADDIGKAAATNASLQRSQSANGAAGRTANASTGARR